MAASSVIAEACRPDTQCEGALPTIARNDERREAPARPAARPLSSWVRCAPPGQGRRAGRATRSRAPAPRARGARASAATGSVDGLDTGEVRAAPGGRAPSRGALAARTRSSRRAASRRGAARAASRPRPCRRGWTRRRCSRPRVGAAEPSDEYACRRDCARRPGPRRHAARSVRAASTSTSASIAWPTNASAASRAPPMRTSRSAHEMRIACRRAARRLSPRLRHRKLLASDRLAACRRAHRCARAPTFVSRTTRVRRTFVASSLPPRPASTTAASTPAAANAASAAAVTISNCVAPSALGRARGRAPRPPRSPPRGHQPDPLAPARDVRGDRGADREPVGERAAARR